MTEAGGGGLPARRAGEFAKDLLDNPQANSNGDQLREGSGTQMFLELFEVLLNRVLRQTTIGTRLVEGLGA